MSQLDNSLAHNLKKQQIFYSLLALNNLHSLSQMITHSPYPQLHTQCDTDWQMTSRTGNVHINGHRQPQTFMSRARQYVQKSAHTFDKLAMLKSHIYDLSVIKHQFWSRIYHMKPVTQEQQSTKKIITNIIWRQRIFPYTAALVASLTINAFTGIHKMKPSKKLATYLVLVVLAQFFVRVRKSDHLFYQIPALPCPQLQKQRQMILDDSIFIDGNVNGYGLVSRVDAQLEQVVQRKHSPKEKRDVVQAMGYHPIQKQDQIP